MPLYVKDAFEVGDHFAYVSRPSVRVGRKTMLGPALVIYGVVERVGGSTIEGTCYSAGCTEGEYGETSKSVITARLSPSEFEYTKDYGWPNDMFAQSCVSQGVAP